MGGRVCGQAIGLAAIHLREEPDALMSARPGPSGGYPARGIPTAIDNNLLVRQDFSVEITHRLLSWGVRAPVRNRRGAA